MSYNLVAWINHNVYYPFKSSFTANQRRLLIVLISLLGVFSICLSIFAIYLAQLFYDPNDNSSVLTWVGLSIVGLCLLAICMIGLRGALTVNLEQLLTFFWGVMVFIAPLVLSVIICFNVYVYIGVNFKHQWEYANFEGMRKTFCEPGTANNKCAAPYRGGSHYAGITEWCSALYNATDCGSIRSSALNEAVSLTN